MEVTDVSIRKYEKGSMLGFVNVEFDKCLEIKGFKLFKGRDGREFDIGLPSEKDKTGKKDENGNDKYWPFIYVNLKTESGKKLMDSIRDNIISKYKEEGPTSTNNSAPDYSGGQDWPAEEVNIPF